MTTQKQFLLPPPQQILSLIHTHAEWGNKLTNCYLKAAEGPNRLVVVIVRREGQDANGMAFKVLDVGAYDHEGLDKFVAEWIENEDKDGVKEHAAIKRWHITLKTLKLSERQIPVGLVINTDNNAILGISAAEMESKGDG